jgi:YHS domain-containing protein
VLVNGRTVYVCCANCAAKVKANPDAFAPKAAAGLPSALPPAPQAAAAALPFGGQKLCPETGEELTSGAIAVNTRGQKVYVCCPGCAMKVKLNPDKYLPAVMEDRAKNGVQ